MPRGVRTDATKRTYAADLRAKRESFGLTVQDWGRVIGVHASTMYRWESMPADKPFYIEPFQERLMSAIELIPLSQRKEVGRELRQQLAVGSGLHALRALLGAIYAPRFVDKVERWPKKKIRRRS